MKNKFIIVCLLWLGIGDLTVQAQEKRMSIIKTITSDSVADDLGTIPAFTIFKDNYIITGSNFSGGKITKYNSDAKLQISLRHRLYKSMLPLKIYLFFTYTQKSYWAIYRKSAPFTETNYNPSLGFGHNFVKDHRIAGLAFLQFEHESNGRDSIWSRSWNKISFTGLYAFKRNYTLQAKFWIPVMVAKENKNLARFAGIGQFAATYTHDNKRLKCSILMIKRGDWNLNANWQLEIAYKIFRLDNQYLFLQFYNGYGENMINYDHFQRYVRVGFVIKPNSFTIF